MMEDLYTNALSWTITAIGFILFISFVWFNRNPSSDHFRGDDTTICSSPNCVRCRQLANFDLTEKLKQRCEDFFQSSDSSPETKSQILSLIIESTENKNDIMLSVYKESGYELRQDIVGTLPHIWMLPGLDRHSFWSGDMHKSLNEVICILENPENVKSIWDEFEKINQHKNNWKCNSVPSGKWRVYHLYDQGLKIKENSDQCPFTTHLLTGLPSFMCRHVYGNAMFSILEPGSSIEPHTGPCNYRLRCHLPLMAPPGYRIRVGTDISAWEEGKLMIFDDSFVHEVWHKGFDDGEVGGRAVLIFDIWHPHVSLCEQAALRYIHDQTIDS